MPLLFWAGLHVALLEFWCGFGVFRIAVTMVLRQGLVGSNVFALCRVQLIAWKRNVDTGCLTVRVRYWYQQMELHIQHCRINKDVKSLFKHEATCLQLLWTDCHLTSSTGDRAGEEVSFSPLVPDWLVEEKLDNCVLGTSILHLYNM